MKYGFLSFLNAVKQYLIKVKKMALYLKIAIGTCTIKLGKLNMKLKINTLAYVHSPQLNYSFVQFEQ